MALFVGHMHTKTHSPQHREISLLTEHKILEAAPSDIEVGHIFGYSCTTSSGNNELVGTAIGIGTGQANTTALVTAMGTAAYSNTNAATDQYAARSC